MSTIRQLNPEHKNKIFAFMLLPPLNLMEDVNLSEFIDMYLATINHIIYNEPSKFDNTPSQELFAEIDKDVNYFVNKQFYLVDPNDVANYQSKIHLINPDNIDKTKEVCFFQEELLMKYFRIANNTLQNKTTC